MRQHNAAEDGRKCWRTARERQRLKSRFNIRERVAGPQTQQPKYQYQETATTSCLSPSKLQTVMQSIRHIQDGDRSKFSLTSMDGQFELLSTPMSTKYLLESKALAYQRCVAWFGKDHTEGLEQYIESLSTFTIMEYALWLQNYSIVGALLQGGINPCIRGWTTEPTNILFWNQSLQQIGSRVLVRFFDCFPVFLATYIVKRVVDMRIAAFRNREIDTNGIVAHSTCPMCYNSVPQDFRLVFLPCLHCFCEPCFWKDLLRHVDHRGEAEDVVLCPICGISGGNEATISSDNKIAPDFLATDWSTPAMRRQKSLEKLRSLPLNRNALKAKKEKKKRLSEKDCLASSWCAAVTPSLGSSQDVRRDKFFAYVERNSIRYVRGCLWAGVDVNWTNEYGQTAIYIAAWRGNVDMVELLLQFGADPYVISNGGSSVFSVCVANHHEDVCRLLNGMAHGDASSKMSNHASLACHLLSSNGEHILPDLELTTLIDTQIDHPGAGSYMVDNTLSADIVEQFMHLWRSLPPERPKPKKKDALCSIRSYYCDAEGYVCNLLQSIIEKSGVSPPGQSVTVYPHMRFLDYCREGTALAPHVDLCRVDPISSKRSTHSFLLYLTDCCEGGETCLLGDVNGDGRTQVLARVLPRRGRLLLFPHSCPHEGIEVVDVPKILLRGEVALPLRISNG